MESNMTRLSIVVFLYLISTNLFAEQLVCFQKGYIMKLNEKIYTEVTKENYKSNTLKFDFDNLKVTRNSNNEEFSRNIIKIDGNVYKEDYFIDIIHAFNMERTSLASTEPNGSKILTIMYSCF